MREESHLDDMRSAIRGDFERLAERRGGQELMSADDEAPEQDLGERTAEPTLEPASESELEPRPEDVSEPEPEPEPDPEPEPEPGPGEDEGEDERPGSWLDRLLGR